MNSVVLILWLVLANGKLQVISTSYFQTEAACQQAGAQKVEAQAVKGRKTTFKCHVTQPEYTGDDVDVNGNLIPR
jgi:hypothetical protein